MDILRILEACTGFDWDAGNLLKNWEKHGVSAAECEQVFFNRPLITGPDVRHSSMECRIFLLGRPDSCRRLFLVCTVRDELIRVISARDMSRQERQSFAKYGGENEEDPQT